VKGYKAIAWTLCLVFLVGMLVQFAASVTDVWKVDTSTLQQVVNAGAMAVLAFLINWAAPWVDRYGIGAKPRHVNAPETVVADAQAYRTLKKDVQSSAAPMKKSPAKRE